MDFASQRSRMVELDLQGRGIANPRVLDAMSRIPRERFVPEPLRHLAYADHPLSLGRPGQTISQPYIVARMTELLEVEAHHRVLEIGSGSGYQTAVLRMLAGEVCAVERDADRVADALDALADPLVPVGCGVGMHVGDGRLGWPERAPFHRILAAAAVDAFPAAWAEQAHPGTVLVAPLGDPRGPQELVRAVMNPEGHWRWTRGTPVSFVPMIRTRRGFLR